MVTLLAYEAQTKTFSIETLDKMIRGTLCTFGLLACLEQNNRQSQKKIPQSLPRYITRLQILVSRTTSATSSSYGSKP